MRLFRPSASRGEIYQTYKDKHYLPLKRRFLGLFGRSLSLSKGRPVPPFLIPGLTRNLSHVIPGLTGNLSKRSAAKSPFYAINRSRCHFINPCLPHSRPPEADFVPDHFGRARLFVISTERQRVEKSCRAESVRLSFLAFPSQSFNTKRAVSLNEIRQ